MILLGGCGGIGAPIGDAVEPLDVAIPAPRCNPEAPFGTPLSLSALNTTPTSEESAFLTDDELTIFFSSTRPGGLGSFDLWFATRADHSSEFSAPQLLGGAVNSRGAERRPVVSADGLYLYVTAHPADNYIISVSQRAGPTAAFGEPMPVTEVNIGSTIDEDAYVLPDHTLYWGADAGGNLDLYRATWTGNGFHAPERVIGIDALDNNVKTSPVVTPDELTLYFQSARANGAGGYDIWMATRSSKMAAFSNPVNLFSLNSDGLDTPNWISPDNCVLYFTRNVGVTTTDYDLFVAVRGL